MDAHEHVLTLGALLSACLFAACFVYGMRTTLKANNGAGQINTFLRRLAVFGTCWFLSFPLLVFTASFFAEYLRHRVVSGGTLVCQTLIT